MHQLPLNSRTVSETSGASVPDAPAFFDSLPGRVPLLSEDAPSYLGTIERVLQYDDDNGDAFLEVKILEPAMKLLVSGSLPFAHPGLCLRLSFPQHPLLDPEKPLRGALPGLLQAVAPFSERTLRKFLKSDAFPAVTPQLATKLAKAHPKDFFQVLEETPFLLSRISGIGPKRSTQILESWRDFKAKASCRASLAAHGLPLSWSERLWSLYGRQSLAFLREHPYRCVVELRFPFDEIDPFAKSQGVPAESPERIRACLIDLLWGFFEQGHCAYPERDLLVTAEEKLLLPPDAIDETFELEILTENLVLDRIGSTDCVYLAEIWKLEREVARKLLLFEQRSPSWCWLNSSKFLTWAQSLLDIQLAPLQQEAIETALSSSLTVITGGPGTGKTTLIRSIVTILRTQFAHFALCSPTGRAAQRLEDATGAPAQTLHRLLKYDGFTGEFGYGKDRPLDLDLVLIDEASMVDLELFSRLLDALPESCCLVLVGDADQLPPIGAGSVLQSLIASQRFPIVRLKEIFRQRETSLIKTNAQRINAGQMPLTDSRDQGDFHYIPVRGAQAAKEAVFELVTEVLPKRFGITDPSQSQILVPLNRGELGTRNLNADLQALLSQDHFPESVQGVGQVFRKGDKVMVTKNDYAKSVFNGDIGLIQKLDLREQIVEVRFETKTVHFGFDEIDRLSLAYAISIHKAQGSEYRAVIVVIGKEHEALAQRHLIYTAVTRGKEQVFLIADPEILQEAVLSDEHNRRWQKLTELLTQTEAS